MAAKREHVRKRFSETPAAPDAPGSGNVFANDGSFMEMFRKRMEEQMKGKSPGGDNGGSSDQLTASGGSERGGQEAGKGEKGGRVGEEAKLADQRSSVRENPSSSSGKPYQGIAGKRKALLRSLEIREKRKRRREELEDQRVAEAEEGRSNAWKAYMAEVKAYEEKCCSDSDGHKRPLVK